MELLVKRVLSLLFFLLFFFSISAENTIFKIVNRIKKRNPADCRLASFHRSSDHYQVICIGNNLNKYLYRIPLTVDSNSSFLIDEDHYLNIDNGLDSIFLAGEFLGRAVKLTTSTDHQSREPLILSLPGQPKLTLRLLDNEIAPELGPFFRVVVDHIKHADHEFPVGEVLKKWKKIISLPVISSRSPRNLFCILYDGLYAVKKNLSKSKKKIFCSKILILNYMLFLSLKVLSIKLFPK